MAEKWSIKELLASAKMNQLGNPKYTDAEEIAVIDGNRLPGMINYNSTNKTVHVFQSGTGSTFDITELTNFLFRNKVNLGITTPQKKVYDESFVNSKGKMNTSVFVTLQYLQETSVAGEIKITLDHPGTNIVNTDTLASDGAPTLQEITYELDAGTIVVDNVVNIFIEILQVQIKNVEIRSI